MKRLIVPVAGLILAAGAGAVRGVARESSPLSAVAERGGTVSVVLELDGRGVP